MRRQGSLVLTRSTKCKPGVPQPQHEERNMPHRNLDEVHRPRCERSNKHSPEPVGDGVRRRDLNRFLTDSQSGFKVLRRSARVDRTSLLKRGTGMEVSRPTPSHHNLPAAQQEVSISE